jgi:hypothetical protein
MSMFRSGALATKALRSRISWLLAVSVLLGACKGDSEPGDSTPPSQLEIDPETGGAVEHSDGSKVTIPANALPSGQPVVVSVGVASDATKPDGAASDIWRFGPAGTTFSTPVTIELPFELAGRDARRFKILWTKPNSETEYDEMPTRFEDGRAKTEVTHFSLGLIRQLETLPEPTLPDCDERTSIAADSADEDFIPDFCQCRAGYRKDGDNCLDIDECERDNGGCDPLSDCINAEGTFSCGNCAFGYEKVDGTCIDTDECATNPCDSLVRCTNMDGSFKCGDCPSGYTGGGSTGCTDRNECLVDNGNCDPNAECLNLAGSVMCGDCKSGYTGTGSGACLASEKAITKFILAGTDGIIDPEEGTITLKVPYGQALTSLKPTIEFVGQSVSPDTLQNFSKPVEYVVTAADGSIKRYTATALKSAVSSAKQITSFKIGDSEGVFGGIDGKTITVTLPTGGSISLDSVAPMIIHDGVVTATGLKDGVVGFTEDVAKDFVVEAEDGTTQVYSVVVKYAASAANTIKSFKLNGVEGIISGADARNITVILPFATVSLNNLIPEIVTDGGVVMPPSGSPLDFIKNGTKDFKVKAQNGIEKTYKVLTKVAEPASAVIKSLKIGEVEGTFSGVQKEIIKVTMPAAASLLGLVPKIISEGTVVPPSGNLGDPIDFAAGVAQKLTVIGGDNQTKKVYDLVVENAGVAANLIKQFRVGDTQAVIDHANNTIKLVMPPLTSLQTLVPQIVSEGTVTSTALVNGALNLTNGAIAKVTSTSNNNIAKVYDVSATAASAAANLIHQLKIGETPGVITEGVEGVINVTLPAANKLLGVVPQIINDGTVRAERLVNGKIDFVNGQTEEFRVKAANGVDKIYKVTVNAPKSAEKLITDLRIGDAVGVFSGPAQEIINVTLPFAATLTGLAPKIVAEGVVDAVGLVNGKIDFTNKAIKEFTVTAEDGSQKVYQVIVSTPDQANALIHSLNINGVTGEFSGLANDTISVLLPFGAELQGLVPSILADGTVTGTSYINGKLDVVNGVTQQLTVNNGDITKTYDLIVKTALDNAANIKSLDIRGIQGVFSGANNDVITTTLPFGTPLTNLVPNIVADGPVTSPNLVNGLLSVVSGISTPLTVTAKNGDKKVYDLFVQNALSNSNLIKSFNIGGFEGVFSGANPETITTTLPFNALLSNLSPKILTDGTNVEADGFTNGLVSFVKDVPKKFTVTAANGEKRDYNVVVKLADELAKAIKSLKLNGFPGTFSGPNDQNIDVKLPFGTLPLGLKPEVVHDGALSVDGNLLSGLNNLVDFIPGFSKPFIVKAADNSERTYNVNAVIDTLQQANEITGFSLLGQPGVIDEAAHTITVAFPTNKNLSNVFPDFLPLGNGKLGGITKSPAGSNYSVPTKFISEARNGDTEEYVLKIINPPAP